MYHYEFGIMIGETQDDPADSTSMMMIDLREIASFWKVENHTGPGQHVYPDVVNIKMKHGDSAILYYPYKEFKQLYENALGVSIMRKPYPFKVD